MMTYVLFTLCIFLRLIIVYISTTKIKKYVAGFTFFIACCWVVIFCFGLRESGPEVFGRKIWWNNLRPVHAFFYFSFSILTFFNWKYSFLFLFFDVIIGAGAFVRYHYKN